MNKNNILEILQDLDSFYTFSEYLPIEKRLEYSSKIESVREKINNIENIKDISHEVVSKDLNKDAKNIENQTLEASFKEVTGLLIPKLSQEGQEVLEKGTVPKELLDMLKLIDNKSSIFELYTSNFNNYKNFFEFSSLLYKLDLDQYISFIKTKNSIPNRGWLKIGEILSNSNIVSQQDLSTALSHQVNKQDKLIGEAMMDLKIISDITLRDSLKIQRWLFKISEFSMIGS